MADTAPPELRPLAHARGLLMRPRMVALGLAAAIALAAVRGALLPVGYALPAHHPHQQGYEDYEGIIHFHTHYSHDATGTFAGIARAANAQGVDFMISTDHNTLQPLKDGKEHWYGKTLFLNGVELTRPEGYLLGMNITHFIRSKQVATSRVIADIEAQGGLLVLAHPEHPRAHWLGKQPDVPMREVLDCADQLQETSVPSLIAGFLYYPLNRAAAWMELYRRPDLALTEWDIANKTSAHTGIYASDFHEAIEISKDAKLQFPKASSVIPIAHDHVLMEKPFSGVLAQDRRALYDALRRGHVYFSLDILQDATGFFFSARQGSRTAWMGDSLKAAETEFDVKLPKTVKLARPRIVVYRNGQEIASSRQPEYKFTAHQAGAYRVEVEADIPTFWGGSRTVTWIYSNPIYLR